MVAAEKKDNPIKLLSAHLANVSCGQINKIIMHTVHDMEPTKANYSVNNEYSLKIVWTFDRLN